MDLREQKRRRNKRTEKRIIFIGGFLLLIISAVLLYQVPGIQRRLDWRLDTAGVFFRSLVNPIGALPTAIPAVESEPPAAPSASPTRQLPSPTERERAHTFTPTPPRAEETPTPTRTQMVIAPQISLDPPPFEGQDWNNCGPVSLSMYLNYFGWEGDQYTIAEEIKPLRADRNVNIEELVDYVYQNIWWLKAVYRVGGDIQLLRKLINAGYPVMVEEAMYLEEEFWFNDDRWAGHYLLLTGYDDVRQQFTAQDSFIGPNRKIGYQELDSNWQAFNRVYLLLYPAEQEAEIQALLGDNWDPDQNRRHALKVSNEETASDPDNPYTWFNLGSNLLYFERYQEAAEAFDKARTLDLPQRMLRYQFGPFLAYFHSSRTDELLQLADYALTVTPNSEEALLWKGWALYRLNRKSEAMANFQKALEHHPGYADAEYAVRFIQGQ